MTKVIIETDEIELQEIDDKLQPLEVIEKADFIGKTKKQIEEIKSTIFLLAIQKITIKNCIKYFENQLKKKKKLCKECGREYEN